MIGEEAFKELCKGKIIRRKDWENKYLMMRDAYPTRYVVRYTFNEAPLMNESLCETDFGMSIDLKCSSHDIWEEYIPLFDYIKIKGYSGFKASIISEKDEFIRLLQADCYDIITAKILFAKYLTDILYYQIKRKPDENVLNFIDKFALSKGADAYNNIIQPLFRSGYCYYFAIMLKDAFNDEGELCLCCPYGHIVWMYKGVPYDIEGVYNGEAELFIPLRFLSTVDIMSFKHVLTDEELGGELDAEYKASVINTFCDSFLKDLGFGGIFEEALEETKEKK